MTIKELEEQTVIDRELFESLLKEATGKGLHGRTLRNYVMNRMKKKIKKQLKK